MRRSSLTCLLSLGVLLWAPSGAGAGSAQPAAQNAGAAAQAVALVERAREAGVRFMNSGDRKDRDAARKDLDEGEKQARAEARRNPACDRCVEVQAAVHLFRSYFKFDDEYDKSIEVAKRGLAQFPQNARLAYIQGYAHYARNEMREAAAVLKRFLAMAPGDPQAEQVRQLVNDSQQKFLSGWYNQANFYQSNESRVVTFNATTFRNEVVFQITPEYEMQLGQMGFTQLSQTAPASNDAEAAAFLRQLVQRLVEKTPGPGFDYKVTVLDSPDVNAVTPPGHIIVYTGLLRFVDTEAQLAGVLAHELAHNYGHHSGRQLIKGYQAQQLAGAVAQAIKPQTAAAQTVTNITANVAVELFRRAYSRFEEQEADYYGAHLMFNGGYNPTSMGAFFLKLYEASPRQPIKFLSTHPPHPDRINNLSDYLEPFPLERDLVVDSSDAFKKLKERYPSAAPASRLATPAPAMPALPGWGTSAPPPSAPPPTPPSPPVPVPGGPPSTPPPPVPQPPPSPAPGAPTPSSGGGFPVPPGGGPDLPGRAPFLTGGSSALSFAPQSGSGGAPPPMPGPPPGSVPPPANPAGMPAPVAAIPGPPAVPAGAPPSALPPPAPPSLPATTADAIVPPADSLPPRSAEPSRTTEISAADCDRSREAVERFEREQAEVRARLAGAARRLLDIAAEERRLSVPDPAIARRREFANREIALLKEQDAAVTAELNANRGIDRSPTCAARELKSPASTGAASLSGVDRSRSISLGVWGPASGDLLVAFSQTDAVVTGRAVQIPDSWSPRVRLGEVVFANGLRDSDAAGGAYINLPQQGDCPDLAPRFAPARLQFAGDTLTLTVNEFKYAPATCTWSSVSERRTYVWQRISR